jgi:hypothetical protein
MSNEFLEDEKVRVDFPDGNWVDLKPELTQADQDYIMTKMMKKGLDDAQLGRLPLLERCILAWSFTKDGAPVGINSDTISKLRRKYREVLLTKINDLNMESVEFQKK